MVFLKEERIKSAQAEADSAKTDLENVQTQLSDTEKKSGSANFLDVEQKLSDARSAFEVAKVVLDSTSGTSDGTKLHDFAQTALDNAKTKLDKAQKDYDDALTTDGAKDVLDARARVEVAQERYNSALDALRACKQANNLLPLHLRAKALEQAKAILDQTQSAIKQAQANLDMINSQIDMLTVRAPMDGVVLVRSIDVRRSDPGWHACHDYW